MPVFHTIFIKDDQAMYQVGAENKSKYKINNEL